MSLINISDKVKGLLESEPATREDDKFLWYKVCTLISHDYECMSFLEAIKDSRTPTPESVRRARQKICESRPDLKGSTRIQTARAEMEEEYLEYARSN